MANNNEIQVKNKENNESEDDDEEVTTVIDDNDKETTIEPMLPEENGQNQSYSNIDVRSLIGKVLNQMGRYQYAILFAMTMNGVVFGINQTLTSFHVYTPTFYCKENNDTPNSCENLPNGTCPSGFRFDDDDYTIVSEWSLVCGKRLYTPLVNTLYFTGVTIASPIVGILADKIGRKKSFLIGMITQCILGILLSYAPSIEFFIGIRSIQGLFLQALQGVTLAMMAEYFPPRFRTTAMIAWTFSFTTGLALISAMSYLCRNWRWLQIIVSVPSVLVVCYSWAVPESMYWLYATNRKDDAVKLCIKTARLNGDTALAREIKENVLVRLNETNDEKSKENPNEKEKKLTVSDIYKTLCLRKHLLICIFSRFSISLAYFSTLFFLNKTTGSRHLNFFTSAGMEFIGLSLVFYLLSYYGRRFSLIFYQLISAVFFGAICFMLTFVSDSFVYKGAAITVLSLLAKAGSAGAFSVMNTFSSELFPTICRGSAFGVIGFWARMGNLAAPFLMVLGEYTTVGLPLGLLFIVLGIGSLLSFMLPETVNKVLPNTIVEAEDMWGAKRK